MKTRAILLIVEFVLFSVCVAAQATLYEAVVLHPGGSDYSTARSISAEQQVGFMMTGTAMDPKMHTLLWSDTPGSVVDLNPTGFNYSYGFGVSDSRQVGYGAGTATADQNHALLWSGSAHSVVDLHQYLPGEYARSRAFGIDSAGNVVGEAETADDQTHAVLWRIPEPTSLALLLVGGLAMLKHRRYTKTRLLTVAGLTAGLSGCAGQPITGRFSDWIP